MPLRQMPKTYGNWHTIYIRFKRWSELGVMDRILHELQRQKIIGVRAVFLDSMTIKAHSGGSGRAAKKGARRSGAAMAA